MHLSVTYLASALFALASMSCVLGSIYVTSPLQGSSCHGGQPCTVEWLDDGEQPLLNTIGECTVGLYANTEMLVQSIQPVDVSNTHSFQFTPDPNAGPNSGTYYIAFTSSTMKSSNGSSPFTAYSPTFSLDQMTGSFDSPVASDTAAIPAPVILDSPSSGLVPATTAGSPLGPPRRSSSLGPATTPLPTSSASVPASSSPSGFTTVTAPSSSAPTSSSPASSGASTTSSSTATATTTTTPRPSTNVAQHSANGQSAFVLLVMGLVVYLVADIF